MTDVFCNKWYLSHELEIGLEHLVVWRLLFCADHFVQLRTRA